MTKTFTFGHLHESKKAVNLPVDVATEITAFIGRRGSGKSHGARVVVEGVLDAGQQVVVFDPLNIWWGLRLRKDGKTAAYDVYIFGGDHADQPLVEQSGVLIADFVIDTGSSVVLSMRHLSKAAMRRFVADFNERLMERKQVDAHRNVLLTVLDEADLFIPQRLQPEATRCFGVVDDLIRRGRASGVGTLMLSQRPAVINKDVLAMTEIMVCLQVVAPQDRKALLAWVEANAEDHKGTGFTSTLPTLKRGEAIIWSPTLLQIFERILIKDTSTYDSSYTPKVGEKSRGAVTLKPVDMAKLTAQLQAVAKEVEENKPAKLKARIKELEREMAKGGSTVSATELATKMVKATVAIELAKARKEWGRVLVTLSKQVATVVGEVHTFGGIVQHAMTKEMNEETARSERLTASAEQSSAYHHGVVNKQLARAMVQNRDLLTPAMAAAMRPLSKYHLKHASEHNADFARQDLARDRTIGKSERKILLVLAHYEGGRSKEFVAAHAGYSVNTGHFNNILSALRARSFISNADDMGGAGLWITAQGRTALGPIEPMPTGEQLWAQWLGKLAKGERAVMEALRQHERLTKPELASAAGYSANTGHFNNCLSKLRSLNLIEGSGELKFATEFKEAIES